MKILLLNPPRVAGFPVVREERFEHKDFEMVQPPLSLLYSASALSAAGHETHLIDANGFDLTVSHIVEEVKKLKPDLLVARIAFDVQAADLNVLRQISAAHTAMKVLVRNSIMSRAVFLKKQLLLENDFVSYFVNGELESTIAEICNALNAGKLPPGVSYKENGKILDTPAAAEEKDLDKFPFPAYNLLPSMRPYHTSMFRPIYTLVMSSRGCPFQCAFCAYAATRYRERSPENVVEELKWLKRDFGLENFVFFDDTISLNMDRASAIFRLMAKHGLGLKFGMCTRVDRINEEMIRSAKAAGCVEAGFGIESGSQKVLDACKKGITIAQIRDAIRICKAHDIKTMASVVLGLPGETEDTIKETFRLMEELDPYYCQYATAVPFPGTEMFSMLKERGQILTEDWEKYNPLEALPVFQTPQLSREQLAAYKKKGYMRFLLRPSFVLKRIDTKNLLWNFKAGYMYLHRLIGILLPWKKYAR